MQEFKEDIEEAIVTAEPIKYLFCYGSNSTKQISKRIDNKPIVYSNAYIENYTRIFAGTSERWCGGIVGLYPSRNMKTYGILVQLTESDLIKLDEFEKGYERVQMQVHNQICDGLTELVESDVYYKQNLTFQYLPSNDYLIAIYMMLQERIGNHKENIVIRGVINEEVKIIGLWKRKYGIKLIE